jgi:hypothetical protein
MSQVDTVVIEETPKPQKVELKAVVNTPAETLSPEEMLTIMEDMEALKSKEDIRAYWKKHEKILDTTIPGSKTTLRELLLGMVKDLNG